MRRVLSIRCIFFLVNRISNIKFSFKNWPGSTSMFHSNPSFTKLRKLAFSTLTSLFLHPLQLIQHFTYFTFFSPIKSADPDEMSPYYLGLPFLAHLSLWLMVSYCDHKMSVVHCASSTIASKGLLLNYWLDFDQT